MIYDIAPVNNYKGNNSTTRFDFNFYIENENQLQVFLFDENKVKIKLRYGIDYSINEFKNNNGSYIIFPLESSSYDVLSEDENISLELTLAVSQETQYNNSSLLNLSELEYSFDYLTRLIQILRRKLELCVKLEECSDTTVDELVDKLNNSASGAIEAKNSACEALAAINRLYDSITTIKDDIDTNYEKFVSIDSITQTLPSKLNTDCDNLSSTGKNNIYNLSSIDTDNYEAWTPPVNNGLWTDYTAPGNGYICISAYTTSTADTSISIKFSDGTSRTILGPSGAALYCLDLFPIAKDETYSFRRATHNVIESFGFYYVKGAN